MLASRDRAVSDDQLTRVQAGDLPRRGALGGLQQLDAGRRVGACGQPLGHAAGQMPAAVAQLDGVDAGSVAAQDEVADRDGASEQSRARADGDGVGGGVGGEHVQGLARGDPEAAALADRDGVQPVVAAEAGAAGVEHRARAAAELSMTCEEVALRGAGEEAQVLRVLAVRDGQAGAPGEGANLRLGERAEREAQAGERLGRQGRERVALVLVRVGGDAQQRAMPVAVAGRSRMSLPGRVRPGASCTALRREPGSRGARARSGRSRASGRRGGWRARAWRRGARSRCSARRGWA